VNIRKGKQILCYEYSMEVDWAGETSADDCDGSFKVSEINESDFDFEVSLRSDIRSPTSPARTRGKSGGKARGILKKVLKDELIKILKPINEEVMAMEADKKKLEEDIKRRKEAEELTAKTREEKGDLKEKLLLEQKEKDRLLKEQFSQLN
jgi:activator of HSP90 ATPase